MSCRRASAPHYINKLQVRQLKCDMKSVVHHLNKAIITGSTRLARRSTGANPLVTVGSGVIPLPNKSLFFAQVYVCVDINYRMACHFPIAKTVITTSGCVFIPVRQLGWVVSIIDWLNYVESRRARRQIPAGGLRSSWSFGVSEPVESTSKNPAPQYLGRTCHQQGISQDLLASYLSLQVSKSSKNLS